MKLSGVPSCGLTKASSPLKQPDKRKAATATWRKAWASWRSVAAGRGKSSLAPAQLPKEKLPFPAVILSGQLKTRQAPGTSFVPYPIPVLAEPRLVIRALENLRAAPSQAPHSNL